MGIYIYIYFSYLKNNNNRESSFSKKKLGKSFFEKLF